MDAAAVLAAHRRLDRASWSVGDVVVPVRTKVGVRGHPGVDPALLALAEALRRGRVPLAGAVLDLSGAPAALPAWGRRAGVAARWTVATPSAAVRAAADATLADVGGRTDVALVTALPWEVAGSFDAIVWRPPADRGWARVLAELDAVAQRVAPGGTVWALQHKDEGAKRAERAGAARFDEVEVVAREAGWRIAALRRPRPESASGASAWSRFDTPEGPVEALPGTFSAAGVDPGTTALLAVLGTLGPAPSRVLDLGCGTGLLARHALRAGVEAVVAVDDDLAAVRSVARLVADDPRARVVHADLLDGVAPLGFDAVWCNPPFHVGRQVVGDLSRAFVAAAHEALRPGGEAWFVANRALPYEAELAGWAAWGDATPADVRAFKVLWARRA